MDLVEEHYQAREICVYMKHASMRRRRAILEGGFDIRIGGMIDLPRFSPEADARHMGNLTRALDWLEVAGFIPFCIRSQPLATKLNTGPAMTIDKAASDGEEEEEEEDESFLEDMGWTSNKDRDSDEGKDHLRQQIQEDPVERLSVEDADFDFIVPAVGVGRYEMVIDPIDKLRKIVVVEGSLGPYEPVSSGARAGTASNVDGLADNEDDATKSSDGCSSSGSYGKGASLEEWRVFVIEEPFSDGTPNCSVGRLYPQLVELRNLLRLEMTASRDALDPVVVTDHADMSRQSNAHDRHLGFASDVETIKLPATSQAQGLPAGMRDLLEANRRHYEQKIAAAGLNPVTNEPFESAEDPLGGIGHARPLRSHRVPYGLQYRTIAAPHPIVDSFRLRDQYKLCVAIEFQVPETEFGIEGLRKGIKEDHTQPLSLFINNVRNMREWLATFLMTVFHIKSADRLERWLMSLKRDNGKRLEELNEVAAFVASRIEKARKGVIHEPIQQEQAALDPAAAPAEATPPAKKEEESGKEKKGETGSAAAAAAVPTQEKANNPVNPTSQPTPFSGGIQLPSDLQSLSAWMARASESYSLLSEIQGFLDKVLNRELPTLEIKWRRPITNELSILERHDGLLQATPDEHRTMLRRFFGQS
jgi:hypothetical protein